MGQQHKKVVKRRRRVAYLERKKEKLASVRAASKLRPRITKKPEPVVALQDLAGVE